MSKKISELTSAVSITGTEEVPIVQSGETKKATVDLLRPPIATSITSSSTNTEVAGAKAVYDKVNEVNLMEMYLSSNYDFTKSGTWQWTKIPFDAIKTNIGSGLSFSSANNSIMIGSNISLVEINWTITTNLQNSETSSIGTVIVIEQNGTQIVPACNAPIINQKAQTSTGTTYLTVAQGDEITVRVQTELAKAYRFLANRCILSVKVLKTTDSAS